MKKDLTLHIFTHDVFTVCQTYSSNIPSTKTCAENNLLQLIDFLHLFTYKYSTLKTL